MDEKVMSNEEFIAHVQSKVKTDPVFSREETVRLYDMAGIYLSKGAAGIPEKVTFEELTVERLVAQWEKLKLRYPRYSQGKKTP